MTFHEKSIFADPIYGIDWDFHGIGIQTITLWLFNIAIENAPFIDDVPTKTTIYRGFSMAMLNNQMGRTKKTKTRKSMLILLESCDLPVYL